MKYRIIDPEIPGHELVLELDPDSFYDDDVVEVGEPTLTELLDWWSDPPGRGYLALEDGGYIVVVDARTGEPHIETWSEANSDTWSLEDFPFGLAYEEAA